MARDPNIDPPEWWNWDLAFNPHVESRMEERGFSEVDLRAMLTDAFEVSPAKRAGRYLVSTRFRAQAWTVVLEPDPDDKLLFVVTAYSNERS
jgi:hypothetical protein